MTTTVAPAPVGDLIRRWRTHRRVSQLALSSETGVSTRHLSYVETGRSRPSREMVLRLAEHLEVPLRERNRLLLAAGFAPAYPEHGLDEEPLTGARTAVREVLVAHAPYPALAVDRTWNVVEANDAVGVLLEVVSPSLLAVEPLNALRLSLHPDGMAPHIANLAQWRTAVLGSLRRSALARGDLEMLALHEELAGYPGGDPADGEATAAGVYVPLQLRVEGHELSLLAIIATFGTPLDVTLSELAIESFFPADPATAAYLRERAASGGQSPASQASTTR